jgi:hypothetical protein
MFCVICVEFTSSEHVNLLHSTIATPPPPVHINNVQLPQEEAVKDLRLHLDRRLSWHEHIFVKPKQLEITLTKMY